MPQHFKDKVVWITGGGSGIGKAMALAFASQGAKVAVSGRRQERLDEVAAEIEALGAESLAVACDVTDEADIEAAVASVVDRFSQLDVAIANAGFSVGGRIEKLTADDWRRQFDVNVVGAAQTVRFALPELKKTRGRVALVGSVAALMAAPGYGAYTASKYALRAIGQTLSIELHGTGVSCTILHPGFVESEIAQVDNQGKFHADRKDGRPQRFMWKAEDAARVCLNAIHKRKREYVFTNHGKLGAFLGQHMPGFVHFAMSRGAARSMEST